MIIGSDKAAVSHGLLGETFRNTIYPVEIGGRAYNVYDTIGLGEHSGGTVDNHKAVVNLYYLLVSLFNSGGVNLLVFVMKCGRVTETIQKNYELFYKIFCDSKVQIVIVVTGCENVEVAMDTWWTDNEPSFTKAGMTFAGHACVCASKGAKIKGGGYRNEDLVDQSVKKVKELVVRHCMSNGWTQV